MKFKHQWGLVCDLAIVGLVLSACVAPVADDATTPEAARRFLKLRGYEFTAPAFFEAVNSQDLVALNAFLTAGINPNSVHEKDGRTALISASARGDVEVVKVLINHGADVNAKDRSGYTALFHALEARYDEVADILISQPGLDVNARGKNDVTALMRYVWRDRIEGIRKLLERGADVNLTDADGDTVLHGAAEVGNIEVLKTLLANKANPNARNKVGGTPLMWAAVYGNENAARLLLENGADPSLKDEDGMTALNWAEKNKREALVKLLRRK